MKILSVLYFPFPETTPNSPLPEKYLDHPLKGGAEFKNCRDCHVKPDLVLIYRLVGDDVLELHQLDSHSEIFG